MRTYHIFNADGVRVGIQEVDDAIAPALLAGHVAKVVEVDGEKIAKKSQPVIGPTADTPMPEHLQTEDEARAEREARRAEREAEKAAQEAANAEEQRAAEATTRRKSPDTPA